ncbi:MAG: monovalent cation/H(+) antiporter subunit G [Candidatus Cloacimonadaceae bacterium]
MIQILGAFISLAGSVFILIGALGVVRMPDVYNRMQTGTKATTLGSILTLLGVGIALPGWLGKVILLIIFIIITNPISSHALARAAHHAGIRLTEKTIRDNYQEDFPEEDNND